MAARPTAILRESGITHAFAELKIDEAELQVAEHKIHDHGKAGQLFHALRNMRWASGNWSWSEPPVPKRRRTSYWDYKVVALCLPEAEYEIRTCLASVRSVFV